MAKQKPTQSTLPFITAIQAFHVIPKAAHFLWKSSRLDFGFSIVTVIIQGLIPGAVAYVGKLIIDTLTQSETINSSLWTLVAIEFLLVLTLMLIRLADQYFQVSLREKTSYYLEELVAEHAASLDLEFYEQPGNYDRFAKAQRELRFGPPWLIAALLRAMTGLSTVAGFFIVVLVFQPILALLLLLGTLPVLFVAKDLSMLSLNLFDRTTPEGRKAAYVNSLLTSDEAAKELRLFNIAPKFLSDLHSYTSTVLDAKLLLEKTRLRRFAVANALSTLVQYGSLIFVVSLAVTKRITIGDFVLLSGALQVVRQQLTSTFGYLGEVLERSLFFGELDYFLSLKPTIASQLHPKVVPPESVEGIVFENITFAYTDAAKPVFRNFNLKLHPGEITALVGLNGAGKTTLVKLLTRLYDPQEGRITFDGIDIREFDPNEYRERFGIILQDFVRYQLSAKENVTLAKPLEPVDEQSLERAANEARAMNLVEKLPDGWDTLLGRQFHIRGQDLSGGEWQRIALARALYRNAPILVLDEPSAALDARAETELFQTFGELTKGRLSLLISHRFNTVRFADRILILENGQIIEDGSHDHLIAVQGRYHELFTAQAKAYTV
jgi:ATP-binding cassette, subfamily B, bacterial